MADNPAYEKPVQHQPNVADDPKGQKSGVRGVPVELTGRTVDEKTGLPKSLDELKQQQDQVEDLKHRGEPEAKKQDENQDS